MLEREPLVTMVRREPFVLESEEKELVVNTAERLNKLVTDKTYGVDFDGEKWYVFEITDEDEV